VSDHDGGDRAASGRPVPAVVVSSLT
jgi:hypothetical protein